MRSSECPERSGEDAHAARPNEEPDDDQNNPEQDLATEKGDESGNHQDDCEDPEQRGHGSASFVNSAKHR